MAEMQSRFLTVCSWRGLTRWLNGVPRSWLPRASRAPANAVGGLHNMDMSMFMSMSMLHVHVHVHVACACAWTWTWAWTWTCT